MRIPYSKARCWWKYAIEQGFVKEGTKCAVLRGLDGTFHSEGRTEGFVSLLTEVGADIVDNQTAEWSTKQSHAHRGELG